MPARRTGADTVTVYDNDPAQGGKPTYQFEHLRQQSDKASGKPNFSLADFISPSEAHTDYLGGFTVSMVGTEALAEEYKTNGDDYNAIMTQALSDRLAEAFAEHLHELIRKDYWGYQPEETLSKDEMIKENTSASALLLVILPALSIPKRVNCLNGSVRLMRSVRP